MSSNPHPVTPQGHGMGWNKPDELREQFRKQVAKWYENGDSLNKLVDELEKVAAAHTAKAVSDTAKAYGGCTNCYGKGYATVNDRWHGHDTDTDIGSPGGYVSGGNANAMKFCKCERGKQLEKLLTTNTPPHPAQENE